MNNLRRFFTVLNLHIAAAVVLAGFVLVLATRAILAVHAAGAVQSDSYQQQKIRLTQLESQMAHLQGLPQKVDTAREDASAFYARRIAPNYSTIAQEIGGAAVTNQVRLTRAQYTAAPAIEGLIELRIDANLSGDYIALMHFINDLERDKNHVFFIINGLAFTGQQGGLVNLRLRLTTYLSANATDLPPANDTPQAEKTESAANQNAQPAALSEGGTR